MFDLILLVCKRKWAIFVLPGYDPSQKTPYVQAIHVLNDWMDDLSDGQLPASSFGRQSFVSAKNIVLRGSRYIDERGRRERMTLRRSGISCHEGCDMSESFAGVSSTENAITIIVFTIEKTTLCLIAFELTRARYRARWRRIQTRGNRLPSFACGGAVVPLPENRIADEIAGGKSENH